MSGTEPEKSANPSENVDWMAYWRILRKNSKLLAATAGICLLIALITTLLSDKIYESQVTIITPKERENFGIASALASSGLAQAIPGASSLSTSPNRDLFLSILKSRSMAQDVIGAYNLIEHFQVRHMSDAVKELSKRTTITSSKEGIITVRIEADDPKLAADIANNYIANLDKMISRFTISEATKQRVFISGQLAKAKEAMNGAELALQKFQEKHRAIALQEQTKSSVTAAAALKGEIVAGEVRLASMRFYATDENQEVIAQKGQIDEMKRQLAQMQYGEGLKFPSEGQNPQESRKEFHVPFSEFPELGLELVRLMRELKVHETVYTLLTQQLEEAKITEARDVPVVQVLDPAIESVHHVRPRLRVNLALAGTLGMFLGVILAFSLEYFRALKTPQPAPQPAPVPAPRKKT